MELAGEALSTFSDGLKFVLSLFWPEGKRDSLLQRRDFQLRGRGLVGENIWKHQTCTAGFGIGVSSIRECNS